MSQNNNQDSNLSDTRDKRKRVQRIKNGIIIAIFVSIIVSFIAIIGLIIAIVNIVGLSNRINTLENGEKLSSISSLYNNDDDDSNIILPGSDDVAQVYLTFDDGPSNNTDDILNILDKYNIKATFFLVANEDESAKEKIKKIADHGHSIGMHSYSNRYSEIYASLDSFKYDVDMIRDYLSAIIGYEPNLYRFPGGSGNKVTNVNIRECIEYLDSQDIRYYDWNVSGADATSNAYTSDELVENVMKDVLKYKTSVVLLHDQDNKGATVDALTPLIESLQEANVELLPIIDSTPLVQQVRLK